MSRMKGGNSKKPVARVVLTDTLPYELPLYFTNFRLYSRLAKNQPEHKLVEKIIGIKGETRPCKFHISKRPDGHRELSLIHPSAQAAIVQFYKRYDGFISQLCSRSTYSLRFPLRPASRFFDTRYSDDGEGLRDSVDVDDVSFDAQSEFASSYFAYRRYSQIYKFFDSEEFLRLEQKYGCLLRIDISKCFASIYTHSISWAVRGKIFAKAMKSNRDLVYFEDEFDRVMRDANWGETNGIVVGPEVSRVFSEIVLQGVDAQVSSRMEDSIVIRRYMDDYFIFAQTEDMAKAAEVLIGEELAKFNLYLNEGKRKLEIRPLVSSLSIARLEVNELCASLTTGLNSAIGVDSKEKKAAESGEHSDGFNCGTCGVAELGADKIIRRIRSIAKRHGVDYSGLAAPALAVIGRRLNIIYSKVTEDKVELGGGASPAVLRYLAKVIRVSEFLYLTDVRSSTSNKIARIFLEVADICKNLGVGRSSVELQMLDVVRKAMSIWRSATLMDLVNAVVAIQMVASGGRGLERVDLENVLSRTAGATDQGAKYFRTVLGIFLCSKSAKLSMLKQELVMDAVSSLSALGKSQLEDASVAYLLLDMLVCPFVDQSVKISLYKAASKQLFSSKEISDEMAKGELTALSRSVYFTNWNMSSGDLRELRTLLRKAELRLAYD